MEKLNPKEKAQELIEKHKKYCFHNIDNDVIEQQIHNAKNVSLITVEQIITILDNLGQSIIHAKRNNSIDYWEEVRNEILNYEL